jgi:hypothetical protein
LILNPSPSRSCALTPWTLHSPGTESISQGWDEVQIWHCGPSSWKQSMLQCIQTECPSLQVLLWSA